MPEAENSQIDLQIRNSTKRATTLTMLSIVVTITLVALVAGLGFKETSDAKKESEKKESEQKQEFTCDLDSSGGCDAGDYTLFLQSEGECVPEIKEVGDISKLQETKYNPLADVDKNGCITNEDKEILFPDY